MTHEHDSTSQATRNEPPTPQMGTPRGGQPFGNHHTKALEMTKPNQPPTVTGYLIRATDCNKYYGNGYPIFVPAEALRRALLTGEYTYTEDDTREIDPGTQYTDPRLNR